jgi:hypothetical protein
MSATPIPEDGAVVVGGERHLRREACLPAGAQHDVGIGAGPGHAADHPLLAAQVRQRDRAAPGEPVAIWQRGKHRVVEDRHRLDASRKLEWGQLGVEHQRQVELARAQVVERVGELDHPQAHLGRRLRRAQLGQRRGQNARRRARERPDAQSGALDTGHRLDLGLGLAQLGEHRLGVAQQHRAGRRGRHPVRVAGQQTGPQLALEAGDLLGDRGLREGQRLSRLGERAAGSDLAEDGQEPCVEHNGTLSAEEVNIIGIYCRWARP